MIGGREMTVPGPTSIVEHLVGVERSIVKETFSRLSPAIQIIALP